MSLKMVNGYMPYKDINMIVTPLMFQISEVFMRVFGSNAIIYYICMSVLGGVFPVAMYKLLKKISKSAILNWCLLILLTFAYSFLGLLLHMIFLLLSHLFFFFHLFLIDYVHFV